MAIRADSIGLLWQELDRIPEKKEPGKRGPKIHTPRSLPPVPDVRWTAPTEFPRLDGATVIALDTETKDPDLKERGPGFRRGAHVVGISVGVPTGERWYFPVRHEVCPEQNMDPEKVFAWANAELGRTGQPKVGANLGYDLDALQNEGVHVEGPFIDVQVAEPLIDENQFSFSLDNLGVKYTGEGKVRSDLEKWAVQAYGDSNYRRNIYRCPPSLVGPYAEGDVDLPLRIWEEQEKLLARDELTDLFRMECELIPTLVEMRVRGCRVDLKRAQELDDELTTAIDLAQGRIDAVAGFRVNVNAGADLARLFDKEKVPYPRTKPSKSHPRGQPSFVTEWLEHLDHPAGMLVREVRKLTKYRDVFVRSYVMGQQINGRIHCQFHQMKGDENGAVTGRFSSSDPNLQNIPSRDEYWGPRIRSMFVPEEGEEWVKHDWSQIEYRFLAHFAVGPSGETVRKMYRDDPKTDFHKMVIAMTGLDRKPAKTINFGLVYGMGARELARRLGMDMKTAEETVFGPYHANVPFVQATYEKASSIAKSRGYVKTILGRRGHFDFWAPARWSAEGTQGFRKDKAEKEYEGQPLARAYTHKALNKVLQGSNADLMKLSMTLIRKSGAARVLGPTLSIVHDEFNHSRPRTKEGDEAVREVKNIMESCIKIKVPVVAEESRGTNWGEAK
jgi:DNA polymerase I-like protein with 3'-5' exonuclease and polymerase domains